MSQRRRGTHRPSAGRRYGLALNDLSERIEAVRAGRGVPHADAVADVRRAIAPSPRGRLVYDREIPDRYLGGLPHIRNKLRWVREHLPRESRIRIGGSSCWHERDVEAWLASLRGKAVRR